MALQSIRYGGGVWKQQEDARLALQNRLTQREQQLKDARTEVDRVHAQCVALLRENSSLRATLSESEDVSRRRDEELHAAKQNVAELMALLTQANESRVALEKERDATMTLWHTACDQEQQAIVALEKLAKRCDEMEHEAERLRDQLYEAQEKYEYQEAEMNRQRARLETLVRSNDARDRQIAALIRERDSAAQRVAQLRTKTSNGDGREVMARRGGASTTRRRTITWTDVPPDVDKSEAVTKETAAASIKEDYEQQKQKLRAAAVHAKTRFERERERNDVLCARMEALQKAYDELLVRFREASKARQRVEAVKLEASRSSRTLAA